MNKYHFGYYVTNVCRDPFVMLVPFAYFKVNFLKKLFFLNFGRTMQHVFHPVLFMYICSCGKHLPNKFSVACSLS